MRALQPTSAKQHLSRNAEWACPGTGEKRHGETGSLLFIQRRQAASARLDFARHSLCCPCGSHSHGPQTCTTDVDRLASSTYGLKQERIEIRKGVRRIPRSVGHRHATSTDQLLQRHSADLGAAHTDGCLRDPGRLRGTCSPGQSLADCGEDLLVGGFRVQAQCHAVLEADHGWKASHALRVAMVCVQDVVHHLRRHHPSQQAGAQVVGEPSARSQNCLGSNHRVLRRSGAADSGANALN